MKVHLRGRNMLKQIIIPMGIQHFIQNLLVDWINKKIPINERYTSFVRAGEIAYKYSIDRGMVDDWSVLEKLKDVHIKITSDEERLRAINFGDYGYFPDGVYGGENPLEYREMIKESLLKNRREREKLATSLSQLIYTTFSGTEVIEEKLKKVLDQAFGIYRERERVWR